MQHPTCTNVRIRSTNDAHKIFAAVQKGILTMVTRRLDADERLALSSGCIYAWEERGPHSELTGLGIERFTEGRRWSPSRVRDEFLFYYEKYSPPADANNGVTGSSNERQLQPPRDWDPLVKQTYSVWVQTDKGRRKWHLTAYFTQTTIDQLGSIDDDTRLRDIVVEDGMFKSTRVGKSRSKTDDNSRSDGGAKSSSSNGARVYAPFPTPYQYQQQNDSANATPVLMHEPYQTRQLDSPVYEQSPSPISAPPLGSYQPDHASFSGSNISPAPAPYAMSSGYGMSPMNPTSDGSHSGHPSNYRTTALHNAPGPAYYSPSNSHSTWEGNSNSAYYPRGGHQVPLSSTSQSIKSPSIPTSSGYRVNHLPASPHAPYRTPYATGHVHGTANPVFSPSYSLHGALALPANETADMAVDLPGAPLSPLHIPDRAHASPSNASYTHGGHGPLGDVPMDAGGEDATSDGALLAPLALLRPPVVKYVRDLQDEKILRRLRERNSNANS